MTRTESEHGDWIAREGALAQLAAERHPEALVGEIPEAWAGHDLPLLPTIDYPDLGLLGS
jgi:hypothetical protein